MTIDDLRTPALLLDADRTEANLRRMQDYANSQGVKLRPHCKTHKSPEVARHQRALGAAGLTVSTPYELSVFANAGFNDLTLAVPVSPPWLPFIAEMSKIADVGILVDSQEAIEAAERVCGQEGRRLGLWIEIDSGQHRSGFDPHDSEMLTTTSLALKAKNLAFQGYLTHGGHAYGARNRDEARAIAEQERDTMLACREQAEKAGLTIPQLSIGSTPAMSAGITLEGISEIRPGNYVFYDYTQAAIESCVVSDCAVSVLATVISAHRENRRAVIDAGALALSKDLGPIHVEPNCGFGKVYGDYGVGELLKGVFIRTLTQEHGMIEWTPEADALAKAIFKVGGQIRILENHSCLTVAMFDKYHVVRGDEVVDEYEIKRGRL